MRSGMRNFAHVIKVHHRLHRFEQFIINQTTDTEKIILLICVICGEKLKTKTMIDYSVYLTGNPMDEMAPEKVQMPFNPHSVHLGLRAVQT